MSSTNSRNPTHDEIAVCAYLIWEKEGCPAGCEREHWRQAELQLHAANTHDVHNGHGESRKKDRG